MKKPLSSDQKWFLRPYFPVIRDIFVLKSGLRFSFREPEVPKLRARKSPQKQPKRAIFAKIDFWGLKYPPQVLVELKTCSTICGTHVHTILNQKRLTGSTVGVREGQKMAQNYPYIAPYCSLFSPSLTPLSTRRQ